MAARDAVFWFMAEDINNDKIITMDPFSSSCVGITSDYSYTVQSNLYRCDFLLLLQTFLGLLIFINHKTIVNLKLVNFVARCALMFLFYPLLITKHVKMRTNQSKLITLAYTSLSMYVIGFLWYYLYQGDKTVFGNI